MRNLRKRQRAQLVAVSLVCLAIATALIGYSLRDGIAYFRDPSQLLENPPGESEVFRLGGLVEQGTLERGEGGAVEFRVTDGAMSVPVFYRGLLPDLFGEGQGMIATGVYSGGVFRATEILAKHDERYIPKEVVDSLKEKGVFREGGS